MSASVAYVASKSCGCPTFASLKPCSPPSNGHWVRGKIGGRWVDTDGTLTMRRVPLDRANVTVCRCES